MQNPNALARYFPTAPELQSISSDTIEMIGTSEQINHEKHHLNNFRAYRTQESAITKLWAEIERVGNSFTCDFSELINIATKAVFAVDVNVNVSRYGWRWSNSHLVLNCIHPSEKTDLNLVFYRGA